MPTQSRFIISLSLCPTADRPSSYYFFLSPPSLSLKAGRYRAKGVDRERWELKGEKAEKSQQDFAVLLPRLFSYTEQPLGPPSVNYLRHNANVPLSSV